MLYEVSFFILDMHKIPFAQSLAVFLWKCKNGDASMSFYTTIGNTSDDKSLACGETLPVVFINCKNGNTKHAKSKATHRRRQNGPEKSHGLSNLISASRLTIINGRRCRRAADLWFMGYARAGSQHIASTKVFTFGNLWAYRLIEDGTHYNIYFYPVEFLIKYSIRNAQQKKYIS